MKKQRKVPKISRSGAGALAAACLALLAAGVAISGQPSRIELRVDIKTVTGENLDMRQVLREHMTVGLRSEAPEKIILFAARMQRGRIVDVFQSRPFKVKPGDQRLLGDEYAPGDQFVPGDQFTTSSGELDVKSVERQIINGIFEAPLKRKTDNSLYLVAVPADAGRRASSSARPMLVLF